MARVQNAVELVTPLTLEECRRLLRCQLDRPFPFSRGKRCFAPDAPSVGKRNSLPSPTRWDTFSARFCSSRRCAGKDLPRDARLARKRFSSTRFMLTGAAPSCGSLAEGPVRRAGKQKTLYVIIRKIARGRVWLDRNVRLGMFSAGTHRSPAVVGPEVLRSAPPAAVSCRPRRANVAHCERDRRPS